MKRVTAKVEPLLIWTRSLEHWSEDQRLLGKELQKKLLHLPAIYTAPLPLKRHFSQKPPTALCFTSKTAASYALTQKESRRALQQADKVFTFSASATKVLRSKGIKVRKLRATDGKEFGQELLKHLRTTDQIHILSAARPAFDLAVFLKELGFRAKNVSIYKTIEKLSNEKGEPIRGRQLAEAFDKQDGVICFASPSAVRAFWRACGKDIQKTARLWLPVCIGQTTGAEARRFFADVVVLSGKPKIKNLVVAAKGLLKALTMRAKRGYLAASKN